MALTVEQILKQSGMSDEAIKALDRQVVSGITTVLTTAAAAQEAAELAKRAQEDLYANQISPALNTWANDSATLKAERDFYRTQALEAKAGGFIPNEAPSFVAPAQRDPSGQFVANTNAVPGSPAMNDVLTAISNVSWVSNEHIRLFGQPMPDEFDKLLREATEAHLPLRDHVSRKYGFEAKKAEMVAAKQKERDDKIRAEARAERDKEWGERTGNNPNVRAAMPSQFTELHKAVDQKSRKDPLMMSRDERRAQTRQHIQKDMTDHAGATVS